MVKITIEQVLNFRNNVGFFSSASLPLKGAYKLNKIRKELDKEEDFYSEELQKIIDKYAKRDENGEYVFNEDGSQIMIEEDKIEDCNNDLVNLQNLEVEVNNFNLSIDDLGENVECTPEQLEALMPLMD